MGHWSTQKVEFLKSVYQTKQLPDPLYPEIAFAGRSNVGKSSLINKLVNQSKLVKISARPGKTQSLNYFLAGDQVYLVDLPGYGYAKVPKKLKNDWQGLISSYFVSRQVLRCVVLIVDIRHNAKDLDLELLSWLQDMSIPNLVVYTKIDKLKRNQRAKNASMLDAAFGLVKNERVLFSAKDGEGKENLLAKLDLFVT